MQGFDPIEFDWAAWVEQEKRSRLMYSIFVADVSLGLYFNTAPLLDAFDIHLPLPADDAAWGALTSSECAKALGLQGHEVAKQQNPGGTRRPMQPEMHLVLKAFLHTSYDVGSGVTNLYGKYILVHGFLALIRQAQSSETLSTHWGLDAPLPPFDGLVEHIKDEFASTGNESTNDGPMSAESLVSYQTVKPLMMALGKFKAIWDSDVAWQSSPQGELGGFGFSRDVLHMYWLADHTLRNSLPGDLEMVPDEKLEHVLGLLRSIGDGGVNGDSVKEESSTNGVGTNEYRTTSLLPLGMTRVVRHPPTRG